MAQVDQLTVIEEMEDPIQQAIMQNVTQTPDLEFSSTQSEHSTSTPSSPSTPHPDSAITELQSAFPSILTASKSIDAISPHFNRRSIDWWYPNNLEYQPVEYPKPQPGSSWTSSFRLFDLPSELRDRIYFHYVSRRLPILHERNLYRGALTYNASPVDPVSLYLTCKQVYTESLSVFCRYNTLDVRLRSRSRASLNGTLRLFPDRPARLVQRVCMSYEETQWTCDHDGTYHRAPPHTTFIQILRDAHTLKSYFPLLRIFTASWEATALTFSESENLSFDGRPETQRIAIWKRWMRRLVVERHLVPPWWLQLQLCCEAVREDGSVGTVQGSFDVAYAELGRELRRSMGEEKVIEESQRVWLEEVERRERKKRRKEK